MVDRYLSDALKARGLRSLHDFNNVGGTFGALGYDAADRINYALAESGGDFGVFVPRNTHATGAGHWNIQQPILMPATRGWLEGRGEASAIKATSSLTGPMVKNSGSVMMFTNIRNLLLDGGLRDGLTNAAIDGMQFLLGTANYSTSDAATVVDARNTFDGIQILNCPGSSFVLAGRGETSLSNFKFQNCGKYNLLCSAFDTHIRGGFAGESGLSNVVLDTSGANSISGTSGTAASSILMSGVKAWWGGLQATNPSSGAVVKITTAVLTSLFGYVSSGGSKTSDTERRKMEFVYIFGGVYTDPTGTRWPSSGAYSAQSTGPTGVPWGNLLDASNFLIKADKTDLSHCESQDGWGVDLEIRGKANLITAFHLNQGSAAPRQWYNNQPWVHFHGGDVNGGAQRAEDNHVELILNDQSGAGFTNTAEAVSFYTSGGTSGFSGSGTGLPLGNTLIIHKAAFAARSTRLPTRMGYMPYTGFPLLTAPTPAIKSGGNTGNGLITMDATEPVDTRATVSTYTVRCTTAATNGGTFEVKKGSSVSNALAQTAIGTVAVGATWANQIKFTIADGSTDFVVGDGWDIVVAQGGTSIPVIRGSKGSGVDINQVIIDRVAY